MTIKRNGFVLAAAILGTAASCVAIMAYWNLYAAFDYGSPLENILSVFTSRTVLCILAVAFIWTGYAVEKRGAVLTASILFCVSPAVYLPAGILFVLPIIFGFIGFAKMKVRPPIVYYAPPPAPDGQLASTKAQYVIDIAKSIRSTVDTLSRVAQDGGCDPALVDEGMGILNEALDTVRSAVTAAKTPNDPSAMPTIDAAILTIDELHRKSLDLIPRASAETNA